MSLANTRQNGGVFDAISGIATAGGFQNSMTSFSGADIKAVYAGVEIGELQQVSWSVVREKGGNYVMGNEDPVSMSRGRRFIGGMFMFAFMAKEALPNAMRSENARGANTRTAPGYYYEWNNRASLSSNRAGLDVEGISTLDPRSQDLGQAAQALLQQATSLPRSLSRVRYADQLMPFNITITACNEYGVGARLAILGVEIMNMESGFAIETMQADHRYTFVAREITEWETIGNDPSYADWLNVAGNIAGMFINGAQ